MGVTHHLSDSPRSEKQQQEEWQDTSLIEIQMPQKPVLRLKMNIATNAPIAGPSPVASAAETRSAKFASAEGYLSTTYNDIRRTNKAIT